MSCPTSVIETYLDGELPPERMLEVQTHLEGCERCSEHVSFAQAMRQSLRQVTYEDAIVSKAFRTRLTDALRRAEIEVEAEAPVRSPRQRRTRRYRRARDLVFYWGGPLGFAACMALWLSLQGSTARPALERSSSEAVAAENASMNTDELLDRLIDFHSAPPAPEVMEPLLVPRLERDVGVRVRMPDLMGAEWQGASVLRVRTLSAATLRYKLSDQHNVTIYVYNAERVPLHRALKARLVRAEPVYVGHRRGYSIAAMERLGLGYAVATDQDDRESVELVTSLH